MMDELCDRIVIADDDAVETQAPAQPPAEHRPVRAHGYSRKIREGRHDGGYTRGYRGGKWRQVYLAYCPFGEVDSCVIAAGRHCSVCAIVFGYCGKRIGLAEIGSLKAAHLGLGDS